MVIISAATPAPWDLYEPRMTRMARIRRKIKRADHAIDHELTCLRILSVVSALSAVIISAVVPIARFITQSVMATLVAATTPASSWH